MTPSFLQHPSGTAHTTVTLTVPCAALNPRDCFVTCDLYFFTLRLRRPAHLSHPPLPVSAPFVVVRASAGAPALPGESESLGGPGAGLLPGNADLGMGAWSRCSSRAGAGRSGVPSRCSAAVLRTVLRGAHVSATHRSENRHP